MAIHFFRGGGVGFVALETVRDEYSAEAKTNLELHA